MTSLIGGRTTCINSALPLPCARGRRARSHGRPAPSLSLTTPNDARQSPRLRPVVCPLPRRRERLVEIVDVEDEVPLRRGKTAEVQQVCIPTSLHPQPCYRRARQIGRHQCRRSSIESERRLHHPSVTDRDKLRHPTFVGLRQKLNRIAAVARCFPAPVQFARHVVAQRPSFGSPFIRRAITPDKARAPFPDANDVALMVGWFW